jgi:DNA-binding LytR/AlgR family response regulator
MRVIIIEDEKLSAEHIELLLKKINPHIEIVATIDSVKKGLKLFSNNTKADLIIVDVHLADGLSFEIFSEIKINTPVIFSTAYDVYAIKAFKLNSVDYLLKPITIENLKNALDKFDKLSSIYKSNIIEELSTTYLKANKQFKNRFIVKMGDSISSIKSEEIHHFICEDRVILLSTNNGKKYIIDYTLEQLESLVSSDMFFRINRNVLINIDSIQKVNSHFNSRLKVTCEQLQDDNCIVSRERVTEFKKWLDK